MSVSAAFLLCFFVSVYVGLGARQARILSEGARHGCNDALRALRAVRALRPLHSYRCLKCGRTHLCGYEVAAVSISCFHLSIYPSIHLSTSVTAYRVQKREGVRGEQQGCICPRSLATWVHTSLHSSMYAYNAYTAPPSIPLLDFTCQPLPPSARNSRTLTHRRTTVQVEWKAGL